MHIMPTSCFSKALQSPKKAMTDENGNKEIKEINENLVEKFIIDNPMIFRICCFCIVRRRMRVVAAEESKQNGHANHIDSDDNIEFTRSSTLALDDIVDEK